MIQKCALVEVFAMTLTIVFVILEVGVEFPVRFQAAMEFQITQLVCVRLMDFVMAITLVNAQLGILGWIAVSTSVVVIYSQIRPFVHHMVNASLQTIATAHPHTMALIATSIVAMVLRMIALLCALLMALALNQISAIVNLDTQDLIVKLLLLAGVLNLMM